MDEFKRAMKAVPGIVRMLKAEAKEFEPGLKLHGEDAWGEALYCADGFENLLRCLPTEQQVSVKASFVKRFEVR